MRGGSGTMSRLLTRANDSIDSTIYVLPEETMSMQKFGTVEIAKAVLVAAGLLLAIPPGFATENADERRDARDTKQDAKQTARKEKVDCKAANQKNNAQCRQD